MAKGRCHLKRSMSPDTATYDESVRYQTDVPTVLVTGLNQAYYRDSSFGFPSSGAPQLTHGRTFLLVINLEWKLFLRS